MPKPDSGVKSQTTLVSLLEGQFCVFVAVMLAIAAISKLAAGDSLLFSHQNWLWLSGCSAGQNEYLPFSLSVYSLLPFWVCTYEAFTILLHVAAWGMLKFPTRLC